MSLYKSIHKDSHDIRLIILQPSTDWSATIRCSLVQASLETGAEFEALSYTWGEDGVERNIMVNEVKVSVGNNLFEALQHLRHKIEERTLWIDALCINQGNTHERNHQVQQMRRIYESSWRVLIWLGLESTDSNLALDFITDMGESGSSRAKTRDETGFVKELLAIRRLCQRPYWERLWIVQEVLVAKKARIQAGQMYTSWDNFDQFALDFAVWSAGRRIVTPSGDDFGDLTKLSAFKLIPRQVKHQIGDSCLRDLLVDFGLSKCKDVRDKVYGLVGLANDGAGLDIDYHKSPFDIFVDVIVLQAYRDCATLPAFSQRLQRLLLGEVSKAAPEDARLSPYVIGVLGYGTGQIAELGPFYEDMVSASLDSRYQHMEDLLSKSNDKGELEIHQLLLLRNQRLTRQQAIPIHTQVSYGLKGGMEFQQYKLRVLALEDGNPNIYDPVELPPWGHLQEPALSLPEKGARAGLPKYLSFDNPAYIKAEPQFFVDDKGYIGVGPSNMRRHDVLCWFKDCDIVAVLRWSKDRYFFVGRAMFTERRWDELIPKASADWSIPIDEPISLYMNGDALRLLTQ